MTYPTPAFYFSVTFDGRESGTDASFQEVSGIGATITTEPAKEGGENDIVRHVPKSISYTPLVLKRGIAGFDSELVQWCHDTVSYWRTNVRPKMVNVRLLNSEGVVLHGWTFADAFPVDWQIGAFNAQKNEVALETIKLVYSHWTRERLR
jgi:phage tail-like protein